MTAILQQLEDAGRNPMVVFHQPLNLHGQISEFPLVTNVYAERERCAQALGLPVSQAKFPLSLEYGRREQSRIAPSAVAAAESPVKEVVKSVTTPTFGTSRSSDTTTWTPLRTST